MKRESRVKRIVAILAALAALAGLLLAIPFVRSLNRAREVLKTEKQHQLQSKQLEIHPRDFSPARGTASRLWLGPPDVRDAVEFEGKVYAATSGGLVIYDPQGKVLQHWTTSDGFPSLDLTSLAVAGDTLWIGTGDAGWLRCKNNNWTQFLPSDKSLRSVHSLVVTRQGTMFLGTASGILRFDGKSYESFYPARVGKATITVLAGDAYQLYAGTFHDGLYLFEKGELKHFGPEEGLTDGLVTDITTDATGAFVATPSGVLRIQNGQVQPILKNAFVQSLRRNGKDLWAATRDRGILRIPDSRTVRRPNASPSELPQTGKTSAVLRNAGNSLIVFAPGRAWYLDHDRWKPWNQPASPLSDSNISSLLLGDDGKMWVGYFDHGLDVLDSGFERIQHYQDDVFFCVNYLSRDSAGNVYVSTANGLAVLHPDGTRRVYREADGLLSDRVMQAVPLDAEGKRVAIATAQGFTLKDGDNLKSLYAFHGLVNNHVYSIAARGDQIYVGTLGGISRIRDMQVVSSWTQMDSGLRRNWVNALLAIDNRLLVGTYGSGIQERSEAGDWTGFEALPADFEVNPNAFFYDGRYVLCGTLDRGVYIYDTQRNKWKQLLRELPGPNATAFARNGDSLYVATDRGMLQISYDYISTMPDLR